MKTLRSYSNDVCRGIGRQLDLVQKGMPAIDFKPMLSIGKGVEEIRVADESGAYRVIYTA